MTLIEECREPVSSTTDEIVPPGIWLTQEALTGLGSLAMNAGLALVGRVETQEVAEYGANSAEATRLGKILRSLIGALRPDQRLIIGPIPGDPKRIGIFVSADQKD